MAYLGWKRNGIKLKKQIKISYRATAGYYFLSDKGIY